MLEQGPPRDEGAYPPRGHYTRPQRLTRRPTKKATERMRPPKKTPSRPAGREAVTILRRHTGEVRVSVRVGPQRRVVGHQIGLLPSRVCTGEALPDLHRRTVAA